LKVRELPADSAAWYEAADLLEGASFHGQSGDATVGWSLPFKSLSFTSYLIATKSLKHWLIV
jgi:hypothetical protein